MCSTQPLVYPRRGGDDFLARLAEVEGLSQEAQPRGSAQSKAGDMKSEKAAAPLDNIKSAMDGAGGFITNFFLGMGASGAKEKELAKKTAPYEGPEVDYALVYACGLPSYSARIIGRRVWQPSPPP
jgi:hypothetical protein